MPNKIKLQAKFTGQDGSVGLKKGKFYDLEMQEFTDVAHSRTGVKLRISFKLDSMQTKETIVDYGSFTKFLHNWSCIMVKM